MIELVVQADDYGASRSITDGILACFAAGTVTQASIMPPAPDAARAAWLARKAGLPLGVHLTLACEWENWRYYPLTPAPTLRDSDGAFLPGIPELRAKADPAEAMAELRAQVAWLRTTGIEPTHVESHVGVFDPELLARLDLPCRDLNPPGSLWHLSVQPYADKLTNLLAHVANLPPGRHMVVAHPAVDGPELATFCSVTSRRFKWARDIRLSDLHALTNPRFLATCAEHGVTLK